MLKIFADRYLPVERFVTVEAGRTEELRVSLLLAPGARPPEDPDAATTPRIGRVSTGSAATTFGWIAAGAGAFFGMSAKNLEDRAGTASPYAISRKVALFGKLDAKLATGCYIGSGVAAGASALFFLLATAPPCPRPAPASFQSKAERSSPWEERSDGTATLLCAR